MGKSFARQWGIAVFTVIFLVMAIVPTTQVAAAGMSTWEAIKKRGTIRFGVIQSEPEFYKDPKTGEWGGYCLKLGKAIAEVMGIRLEPVETTWGNAVAALQSGQIDTMFNLVRTPKRALAVDFTRSATAYNAVGILSALQKVPETWEALRDVRLGVTMGTVADLFITKRLPGAKIERYPSMDEAVASFHSGRVDCYVAAQKILCTYRNKIGKGKIVLPKPFMTMGFAVAVRREPDKTWRDFLDTCVAYYYETGKIQEWYEEALKSLGIAPKTVLPIMKERW